MDVALGEMDGWQATRLIKPIFDTSSPRVLRKSLIRIAARSVSSNL